MKKQLLIIFLIVLKNFFFSQNTFLKTYGTPLTEGKGNCATGGNALCKLKDENGYAFVGSGYGFGFAGNKGIGFVKTNNLGDTIMTRNYFIPDSIADFTANSIYQNPDNGFTIGGYSPFYGSGIFRIAANGNLMWSKSVNKPSASSESIGGYKLPDNSFVFCGRTQVGSFFPFIGRLDYNGNLLFGKRYSLISSPITNGVFFQTKNTLDGNLISNGHILYASPGFLNYLLKTDVMGNVLWSKGYGVIGRTDNAGKAFTELSDKSLILVGSIGPLAEYTLTVTKLDSLGNHVFTKLINDTIHLGPTSLIRYPNNDFVVTAQSMGHNGITYVNKFVFMKFNSAGNLLWSKSYSDIILAEGTQIAPDGGIVILDQSYFGMGSNDWALIKTDFNGNLNCFPVPSTLTISVASVSTSIIPMTVINDLVSTNLSLSTSNGMTLTTICENIVVGNTELNEDSQTNFVASPNPFNEKITITNVKESDKTPVVVYNYFGEEIFSSQMDGKKMDVDLSNQTTGIYFVKIGFITKKVIKE